MINYYVDPGSGFVFGQNLTFLWGIIIGLSGMLVFFWRILFNFLRKYWWVFLILLIIITAWRILMRQNQNQEKIVILGIDAMDPNITESLISQGRLPNLAKLKSNGTYSRLSTTNPSESIVAWSSFATGLNPGSHGIFDFVMRNPEDYQPYLALNEISNAAGVPKASLRRKGKAFWEILSKNKIPSMILFCPNTFPPDAIYGKMLSGMGTPDITGTMGRFSFYTTRQLTQDDTESRGRIISVDVRDNVINSQIFGPKVTKDGSVTEALIPLKIDLSCNTGDVVLCFQGQHCRIKKGKWSGWQKLTFTTGLFKQIQGITRFYLKSGSPEFELYMSPINFDPRMPPLPISYPAGFSKELANKIGLYYTQGMPYDTWALAENRLDEKAFLDLTDEIVEENERILSEGMREFKRGVFFFYFETLDMIQHMFWRYIDKTHPLFENDPVYQNTIFSYYEKIDSIIGKIIAKLDNNTTLIVLSDHGFNSFRRAVHINRWLLENGYLFLKSGATESKGFCDGIDWANTKAYAFGFGGIYLNKAGREISGIVKESDASALKQAIVSGLKKLKDPKDGMAVVHDVYLQEDIFKGPYQNDAPDLLVGFNSGYRASWQTALGGVPPTLIEDNKKKWSGDHLMDPVFVPGIIFSNRKIKLRNPSITDIVPAILEEFKINKPAEMKGGKLFKNEDEN